MPGSYAILLFTASDFPSITSHIHNWVLFLLWLHFFILSGVISPLISNSILGTYPPRGSSFNVLCFCLFILLMGSSRQEYWSGLPSLLQWTTFCLNSPSWPVHLGWPYTAWLIVSLSWTRLWSMWGFPGGSDGKAPACNVGDPGLIPGLGRSPGEGNGNPLQHCCLENPMDRGAW